MPRIGLTMRLVGKDCCLIMDGLENKDWGSRERRSRTRYFV
jgi:hypothetical protein